MKYQKTERGGMKYPLELKNGYSQYLTIPVRSLSICELRMNRLGFVGAFFM